MFIDGRNCSELKHTSRIFFKYRIKTVWQKRPFLRSDFWALVVDFFPIGIYYTLKTGGGERKFMILDK